MKIMLVAHLYADLAQGRVEVKRLNIILCLLNALFCCMIYLRMLIIGPKRVRYNFVCWFRYLIHSVSIDSLLCVKFREQ